MVGMRELDQNEYSQWRAASEAEKRTSRTVDDYETYDRLERNITLIGCVALEDRLQDGVDKTIDFIK